MCVTGVNWKGKFLKACSTEYLHIFENFSYNFLDADTVCDIIIFLSSFYINKLSNTYILIENQVISCSNIISVTQDVMWRMLDRNYWEILSFLYHCELQNKHMIFFLCLMLRYYPFLHLKSSSTKLNWSIQA